MPIPSFHVSVILKRSHWHHPQHQHQPIRQSPHNGFVSWTSEKEAHQRHQGDWKPHFPRSRSVCARFPGMVGGKKQGEFMDPGRSVASPSAITKSNQAPRELVNQAPRELVVHDRDRSGREHEEFHAPCGGAADLKKNIEAPHSATPHSPRKSRITTRTNANGERPPTLDDSAAQDSSRTQVR